MVCNAAKLSGDIYIYIKEKITIHIILNKNVFAPPTLTIEINNGNRWTDLIGFSLYDQNKLEIGKIEDVYINGEQILLAVNYKEDEILIPITDELILANEPKQKKLTLEIANGLLEL